MLKCWHLQDTVRVCEDSAKPYLKWATFADLYGFYVVKFKIKGTCNMEPSRIGSLTLDKSFPQSYSLRKGGRDWGGGSRATGFLILSTYLLLGAV